METCSRLTVISSRGGPDPPLANSNLANDKIFGGEMLPAIGPQPVGIWTTYYYLRKLLALKTENASI